MKNPAERTYIKHGIWHLGRSRKQKGKFLLILGSLPLLVSAASVVAGKILKGSGSKIFGRGKGRSKRKRRRIRRLSFS